MLSYLATLLRYAVEHEEGFTVLLYNGKITPVVPSRKKRYVVAWKTLITMNYSSDAITIYPHKAKKG